LKADGAYGEGELLFCRKVIDPLVSDRLAAMILDRQDPT